MVEEQVSTVAGEISGWFFLAGREWYFWGRNAGWALEKK
jgi:hypothetical protein